MNFTKYIVESDKRVLLEDINKELLLFNKGRYKMVYELNEYMLIKRNRTEFNSTEKEFNNLKDMYGKGLLVPRPLAYNEKTNELYVEKIQGKLIKDYFLDLLDKNNPTVLNSDSMLYLDIVIRKLIYEIRKFKNNNYFACDLHGGNIVVTSCLDVYFIDVDDFEYNCNQNNEIEYIFCLSEFIDNVYEDIFPFKEETNELMVYYKKDLYKVVRFIKNKWLKYYNCIETTAF